MADEKGEVPMQEVTDVEVEEPEVTDVEEAVAYDDDDEYGGIDDEEYDPAFDIRTRKDRLTGSTHFGDQDFYDEGAEEIGEATWGEVCRTCCVHTPKEWAWIWFGIFWLCMFLYFFLLGLELLGSSAKVLGGCTAGSLLGDDTNPVAALMIGILATVLLQSSSTTTSIVVSLVGSGSVSVEQGIYMVMGANIGTSVTNTIVAMGQMGDGDQLERAFAGAVVHDMFNFLTVIILLPIEVITGYLEALTSACVKNASVKEGEKWEGPIKKIVSPLGNLIIIANKSVIKGVAKGKECSDFYPITCENPGNPSAATCDEGLIACDKSNTKCPAFFDVNATEGDDKVSGGVCFFLALVILIVCLIGLVTLLQKMLLGTSTRIIYKATNINGYVAMAIGAGITLLVQSSSITTSTLTPLVGIGVLHIEQMYPLTLGANIGTTGTAILAALVADTVDSLQVALAHLFFNITGILIWYPIPWMRRVPIGLAINLGKATRIWRGFPIVYIGMVFLVFPIMLLGISELFTQDSTGLTVLGAFICVLIGVLCLYCVFWWKRRDGKAKLTTCMANRQKRRETLATLPVDMHYLKSEIERLREHTGLPEDEPKEEKDVEDGKELEDSSENESEDSSDEVEA